uniref:Ig-like domain-containing protein n=1 Tax=Oryzias latipes TaxID=8090 RepID=A0A3P9KB99_ORYLA
DRVSLLLWFTSCIDGLVHTAAPPRLITTIEVKVGEKVTFNCSLTADESRFVQWYKQSPGKVIETVASGAYSHVKLLEPFNDQRFEVNISREQMFLTITSVTKEDEAEYFCQGGGEYLQVFKAGFLLTVKGNTFSIKHIKNHPSTLKNNITCPGNQNVHWFRSASGSSHPGVIFTPTDLNNQTTGKSCVYRLTKTSNDSSDAGIYYCAVAMCGEILFGNGTRVEIGKYSGMFSSDLDLYQVLVDIKALNPFGSSRPTRQCAEPFFFNDLCSFSSSDRPSRKASASAAGFHALSAARVRKSMA